MVAAVMSVNTPAPDGVVVNSDGVGADPGHFVRELEQWRLSMGLSSNAFADYLDISRSYWSLLRRGKRAVTMALVKRVLRERPALAYAVTADATDPRR